MLADRGNPVFAPALLFALSGLLLQGTSCCLLRVSATVVDDVLQVCVLIFLRLAASWLHSSNKAVKQHLLCECDVVRALLTISECD